MPKTVAHIIKSSDSSMTHTILIDDKLGELVPYTVIAKNGNYRATTKYYEGELPELFLIEEVDFIVREV